MSIKNPKSQMWNSFLWTDNRTDAVVSRNDSKVSLELPENISKMNNYLMKYLTLVQTTDTSGREIDATFHWNFKTSVVTI